MREYYELLIRNMFESIADSLTEAMLSAYDLGVLVGSGEIDEEEFASGMMMIKLLQGFYGDDDE